MGEISPNGVQISAEIRQAEAIGNEVDDEAAITVSAGRHPEESLTVGRRRLPKRRREAPGVGV